MTDILFFIAGVSFGYYLGRRKCDTVECVAPGHSKVKEENKKKILSALRAKGRITNDEVQKLTDRSDAMSTIYLQELEDEGKIKQVGTTGQSVFYTIK